MEIGTQLSRVSIPKTSKVIVFWRDDSSITQDESLPEIFVLLDRISKQLGQEEREGNTETSEQQLNDVFVAVISEPP